MRSLIFLQNQQSDQLSPGRRFHSRSLSDGSTRDHHLPRYNTESLRARLTDLNFKNWGDWHLVTSTEVESSTRKLPVSFRSTFYVFFSPLRSDKTCHFHQLQSAMCERGYTFRSVEEKQATGRLVQCEKADSLHGCLHFRGYKWLVWGQEQNLRVGFFLS